MGPFGQLASSLVESRTLHLVLHVPVHKVQAKNKPCQAWFMHGPEPLVGV